ncbi:MAG: hypothetical protein AAB214_06735, partial [Fibrobacterota bacterium]
MLGVYRIRERASKKRHKMALCGRVIYIRPMSLPSPWDCLRAEDMPVDGLRVIAKRLGPRVAADVWRA